MLSAFSRFYSIISCTSLTFEHRQSQPNGAPHDCCQQQTGTTHLLLGDLGLFSHATSVFSDSFMCISARLLLSSARLALSCMAHPSIQHQEKAVLPLQCK